jgi:hypothetical protein
VLHDVNLSETAGDGYSWARKTPQRSFLERIDHSLWDDRDAWRGACWGVLFLAVSVVAIAAISAWR